MQNYVEITSLQNFPVFKLVHGKIKNPDPVPGSGNILMTGVIFLRQVLLAVWPMRRR